MLENSHFVDERSFVRKFIAFHLHAAKAEHTFKLQFMAGAKGETKRVNKGEAARETAVKRVGAKAIANEDDTKTTSQKIETRSTSSFCVTFSNTIPNSSAENLIIQLFALRRGIETVWRRRETEIEQSVAQLAYMPPN